MKTKKEDKVRDLNTSLYVNEKVFPTKRKNGSKYPRDQVAIRKGTKLLVEKPFACVLKQSLQGQLCDQCFSRKPGIQLRRCSGCQMVWYCGQDCQRDAWLDGHKAECTCIRRVQPNQPTDTLRLLTRILFKLRKGGDETFGKLSGTRTRKWKDLMSHYPDLKTDGKRGEYFQTLCVLLLKYVDHDLAPVPNLAELAGIFGRICINSFDVLDSQLQSVGTAVYLGASVIDHSCRPNAIAIFKNSKIHVRAIVDFENGVGWDEIRICYIDQMQPAPMRRLELKSRWYFECNCERCKEKEPTMEAIKCSLVDCGGTLSMSDDETNLGACDKCGNFASQEESEKYVEAVKFSMKQLKDMEHVTYVDMCKTCMSRQDDASFHPLHHLRAKMADATFGACLSYNLWEEALKFGMQTLPAFKTYYNPSHSHPLYGLQLLKVGKLLVYLGKTNQARQILEEAESVIRTSHGTDDQLYVEELQPLLEQVTFE